MFKHSLFYLLCCITLLSACRQAKEVTAETHPGSVSAYNKNTSKHEKEKQDRDFFDAEIARLTGQYKQSLQLYKKFVEAYPNNATAHYVLARLYFQQNMNSEAEKYAKKACTLDPDNSYFRELYTQTLMYQNKYKEADAQYELLVKSNPENPDYLFRMAIYDMRHNRYDKALNGLTEYEKLTGFNEDITLQKKNLYQKQKKYKEALSELRKLQTNDPHNVEYVIMETDIFEEMKAKDSIEQVYQRIEKNYSDEPLAVVALAQHAIEKKDTLRYQQYMKDVIKNKNLSTETKIALILPSLKTIDTDSLKEKERLAEITQSLYDEDPTSKEALILYADVLYYSGKNETALKLYKQYIQLDSNKLNPYLQVMSLSFDMQQYDSTIRYGRIGYKLFEKNALPYFYTGIAFSQLKQTDSCIHYLNQALLYADEQRSLVVQILSSLGDAYNTKKVFASSDSCFQRALKLSSDDAGILNNYAYYLSVRKERLEDAERMSKRSLELQPDSKSFLDTYGWILYQQGKYDDARVYIEKAIKASGENDATLYEHLGDVYYKLKNNEQALYYWKQAQSKGEASESLLKKINTQHLDE